jgi:hypothetical protein
VTTLAPVVTFDQSARGLLRREAIPRKTRITTSVGGEGEAIERLKAELTRAFAAPDDAYQVLSAAEVIFRNREHWGQ